LSQFVNKSTLTDCFILVEGCSREEQGVGEVLRERRILLEEHQRSSCKSKEGIGGTTSHTGKNKKPFSSTITLFKMRNLLSI